MGFRGAAECCGAIWPASPMPCGRRDFGPVRWLDEEELAGSFDERSIRPCCRLDRRPGGEPHVRGR